jgi:hypothetical protein
VHHLSPPGVTLRIISTFMVMYDRKYTLRERVFYAVAWTPKATVQASLSAVPLALIQGLMAGRPDYDVWLQWGQEILTTGVFAIIICGTLGTLMVFLTAPVLLNKGEVGGDGGGRMAVSGEFGGRAPELQQHSCRRARGRLCPGCLTKFIRMDSPRHRVPRPCCDITCPLPTPQFRGLWFAPAARCASLARRVVRRAPA